MDETTKNLVRESWAKVVPISDEAAELFYAKLFELDPELKALFVGDMAEQGRKLMQMLSVAVNGLDKLDKIVPSVRALGKRHVAYGVKDEDYDTVAQALLFTLGEGLQDGFTDEVKAAWVQVYTLLATTMKEAAAEEEEASEEVSELKPAPIRSSKKGDERAMTMVMTLLGVFVIGTIIAGMM